MGKIRIQNMKFYTYNGVLKEERVLGQPLALDIEMTLPLEKAGQSDQVADTVSYAEVYEVIKEVVTTQYFDLIEAVASAVLDQIEKDYCDKLQHVLLKIRKYSVPINGVFDHVEIEMERNFHK